PRLQRDREALLWVRWQLEQDRAGSVLEPLGRLLEDAQEGERMGIVWEGQLLMALAYAALKRLPAARKQLQELFERVYAVGYVRLFLDEGEPLAALLQSILPAVRGEAQLAALRRLLLAFARQRATDSDSSPIDVPLVEPLSMQEQRVLQLLAVGRSNPEIARELVVSVNTVKAQVQSIYRKLNVTNRVEASEVARLLKLL
ncbi:MAG: transcriptional regulator, partial [Ktedonobacteraceae bacterium]|nr:transcriptional regulator [Ktedonobacteraceae bacterium]